MTTTLHERSVHIDASVGRVFDYVQEPRHFLEAFPEDAQSHMGLTEVKHTPDGAVSSYRIMGRVLLLFHMEWTITREEYVRNERIVDHASLGGMWTYTFEPDETGTTLTIAFGWSGRVPDPVGKVWDRMGWNGDEDLDAMLANLKQAIEI